MKLSVNFIKRPKKSLNNNMVLNITLTHEWLLHQSTLKSGHQKSHHSNFTLIYLPLDQDFQFTINVVCDEKIVIY